MEFESITSLVSSLGVGGILAWYLYYNTSVAMPKRDEQYTATMSEVTDKFTQSLTEEREFRKSELDRLEGVIRSESNCRYDRK